MDGSTYAGAVRGRTIQWAVLSWRRTSAPAERRESRVASSVTRRMAVMRESGIVFHRTSKVNSRTSRSDRSSAPWASTRASRAGADERQTRRR